MAQAPMNDSCIVGLPTCGYAFNSARMAFVAAPGDDEFRLELNILEDLLKEKGYEAYIALQKLEPNTFAFCTKICSRIITSQFCIVLLNSSSHRADPTVKIPNANVHLEYGLMLGFKKYILPFQREQDTLAFNVSPLDIVKYSGANFKTKANDAIDGAILAAGTTNRPTETIVSPELFRYLALRGLRISDVTTPNAGGFYRFGSSLGFNLLDGANGAVIYFGVFEKESAQEIVFRTKLLIQTLHDAKHLLKNPKKQEGVVVVHLADVLDDVKIQILISRQIDKEKATHRIAELTTGMIPTPFELLTMDEINALIKTEYDKIGDI